MTYKKDFAERFAEICGSSQAKEAVRKLDISYQAARNYLGGRLPDSKVLMMIAEKTPYSIHWLLTGKGGKFAENYTNLIQDKPPAADQIRNLVREELLKILNQGLNDQVVPESKIKVDPEETSGKSAQPRLVQLSVSKIKREKAIEEKISDKKIN